MAVVVHTHESEPEGDLLIGRIALRTSTVSVSGSLSTGEAVDIAMNDWALFPNIYGTGALDQVLGHSVDGADPDSPRLRLFAGVSTVYNMDYRYFIS